MYGKMAIILGPIADFLLPPPPRGNMLTHSVDVGRLKHFKLSNN